MIQAKYTLWHVLFNISLYTLVAIGVMYAIFFYLKKFNPQLKNPDNNLLTHQHTSSQHPIFNLLLERFGKNTHKKHALQNQPMTFGESSLHCIENGQATNQQHHGLMIESHLELEVGKSLYVARCGQERFLIASHPYGLNTLSRLHSDDNDSMTDIPDYQIAEQVDLPIQLSLSERLKMEARKKYHP